MDTTRRLFLATAAVSGAGLASAATPADAARTSQSILDGADFGLRPGRSSPQTKQLQRAMNAAVKQRKTLLLPGGVFFAAQLRIRGDVHLQGVPGSTRIIAANGKPLLRIDGGKRVRLDDIIFDGNHAAPIGDHALGLVQSVGIQTLQVERCEFVRSRRNGLSLKSCAGSIQSSRFAENRNAGVFSLDSDGLLISGNRIEDCSNNGILIWQSEKRHDGSIVTQNHIRRIGAKDGGSGQNGNGINIYRAANVTAAQNTISECTFSAVRCNAGDNVQITGNTCTDLGETALYVEFGFEGAVISNNVVDLAAIGIAITNLNVGGRLAACSGNVIRNITRTRVNDSSGIGIGADGDSAVTGNVIENAHGAGIALGWGPHLQNAIATGNMIKDCNVGVEATTADGAGKAIISNNIIAAPKAGGIFGMHWAKRVTDDLSRPGTATPANLSVSGNQVV
ncbi:MAG: TIGR03808 family TAT-translocated repetitive protein [Pseudomonadota bacterium]